MTEKFDFSNPEDIQRILLTHEWQDRFREQDPKTDIEKIRQSAAHEVLHNAIVLEPLGYTVVKELFVEAARTNPNAFASFAEGDQTGIRQMKDNIIAAVGEKFADEANEQRANDILGATMRTAATHLSLQNPAYFLSHDVFHNTQKFFGLKEQNRKYGAPVETLFTPEHKSHAFARYWQEEHAHNYPSEGALRYESGYDRAEKIFGANGRTREFSTVQEYLQHLWREKNPTSEEKPPTFDDDAKRVERYTYEEYLKERYGDAPDAYEQSQGAFNHLVRQAVSSATRPNPNEALEQHNLDVVLRNIDLWKPAFEGHNDMVTSHVRSAVDRIDDSFILLANTPKWLPYFKDDPERAQNIISAACSKEPSFALEFYKRWIEAFQPDMKVPRELIAAAAVKEPAVAMGTVNDWASAFPKDSADVRSIIKKAAAKDPETALRAMRWPDVFQEHPEEAEQIISDAATAKPNDALTRIPEWSSMPVFEQSPDKARKIIEQALSQAHHSEVLLSIPHWQPFFKNSPEAVQEIIAEAVISDPDYGLNTARTWTPFFEKNPEKARELIKGATVGAAKSVFYYADSWSKAFKPDEARQILFDAAESSPLITRSEYHRWLPIFEDNPRQLLDLIKKLNPEEPEIFRARIKNAIRDLPDKYQNLKNMKWDDQAAAAPAAPVHPYAALTEKLASFPVVVADHSARPSFPVASKGNSIA